MDAGPEGQTTPFAGAVTSVNFVNGRADSEMSPREPLLPSTARKSTAGFGHLVPPRMATSLRSISLPRGDELDVMDERTRLLRKAASGVYARRWYILLVACAISALEGMVFNTWGPITGPAKMAFGWSDGNIALLANWGNMGYLISALPLSWLLDEKGKL